jgi:hypothetical protein
MPVLALSAMGLPEQVVVTPPGTVIVAVGGVTDTAIGIDIVEQPATTITLTW